VSILTGIAVGAITLGFLCGSANSSESNAEDNKEHPTYENTYSIYEMFEEGDYTDENIKDYSLALQFLWEDYKEYKESIREYPTDEEISKMSVEEKAEYVGLSTEDFELFTQTVNAESGKTAEDKLLVAATIWNRMHCKKWYGYDVSVADVVKHPNQFEVYNPEEDTICGSSSDKPAQNAIVKAYIALENGSVSHKVCYFNSIGYNRDDDEKYYYDGGNYFMTNNDCKCKWCSDT